MKQRSTFTLKAAVIFIGMAVFALCIHLLYSMLTSHNIGGYLPILIGVYITALPFFIALYQGFQLLTYIDKHQAFSNASVRTLKNIKYCASIISLLYAIGLPYIYIVAEQDDAPGIIVIGFIFAFASMVIAVFAGVLQALLKSALEIKSENDLTV